MDNKLDPNEELPVIMNDALIEITISGSFYNKLRRLLFEVMGQKSNEPHTIPLILKELETREPNDLWEAQVTTYLALCHEIEEKATAQKKTTLKKVSDIMPDDPSEEASPES
jgi:hypothetical protein